MGIRETMNKNPAIAIGVVSVIILLAGYMLYSSLNPDSGGDIITKAYYSIDDGASFFVDEIGKVPPFKKDGKDAVRAHVYECDGKRIIAYLEKYSPQAKAQLEKTGDNSRERAMMARIEIEEAGRLVKKPKGKDWVSSNRPEFRIITQTPKCNGVEANWVLPE